MANYKVGDEVVCVDSQTILYETVLIAGATYKVVFLAERCVALDGVYPYRSLGENNTCCACLTITKLAHFFPSRFLKLDGLTEDQTTENEVTA